MEEQRIAVDLVSPDRWDSTLVVEDYFVCVLGWIPLHSSLSTSFPQILDVGPMYTTVVARTSTSTRTILAANPGELSTYAVC